MKITFDTEGDDYLARMYMASVVGPFRRPNGQTRQVSCLAGSETQLILNQTPRVLSVVASTLVAPATVLLFTQSAGGVPFTARADATGVIERAFVLKPGEAVAVNPSAATVVNIFYDTF